MAFVAHDQEKTVGLAGDIEKGTSTSSIDVSPGREVSHGLTKHSFWSKLYSNGVEFHGGAPIPVEEQTDTRYFNVFTVYSTSMISLLP
jgi:hypothetical protein